MLYQLSYSRFERGLYATPEGDWSGKRDSNSRPRPWQGRALPTELFPQRRSCDTSKSGVGAGNETRTRDPDLGKVVLYQLSYSRRPELVIGAGNETRTRDPDLGKVVLYQLSYSRITRRVRERIWSGKRDSNSRPRPWQGRALPTELFPQSAL